MFLLKVYKIKKFKIISIKNRKITEINKKERNISKK